MTNKIELFDVTMDSNSKLKNTALIYIKGSSSITTEANITNIIITGSELTDASK